MVFHRSHIHGIATLIHVIAIVRLLAMVVTVVVVAKVEMLSMNGWKMAMGFAIYMEAVMGEPVGAEVLVQEVGQGVARVPEHGELLSQDLGGLQELSEHRGVLEHSAESALKGEVREAAVVMVLLLAGQLQSSDRQPQNQPSWNFTMLISSTTRLRLAPELGRSPLFSHTMHKSRAHQSRSTARRFSSILLSTILTS